MTRREAARLIGASAAGLALPISARTASESTTMLARTIPSSGEKLPVIGLGTWRAFDVDLTTDTRRQLEEVLSLFVKLGGRVIDSSPMYGRAEEVIGDSLRHSEFGTSFFSQQRFGRTAKKTESNQWNVRWRCCARNESI
jgi:Aldo/keto reductase family